MTTKRVGVRQTEDGFVLEGTTRAGVPVRLTISGLNDDPVPLVIVSECQRCAAELTRRSYASTAGEPEMAQVDMEALTDSLLADTHQCREARP